VWVLKPLRAAFTTLRIVSLQKAACGSLKANAAARSVDEAKGIRDKAIAIEAYARQANNKDLQADAAAIIARAEIRLGELLAEEKASGGLSKGGKPRAKNRCFEGTG
jgi:hypothetical protein